MSIRTTQQHVSVLAPGDGKLRATQQHISILAPGNGELRTTRQYVEILIKGSGLLRSTRQYIEILSKSNPYGTSDIGVSHVLDLERVQTTPTTSTLAMSQDVVISPHREDVESTLSLSSSPYQPVDVSPDVEHIIGVDHELSYTIKYDIYAVEHTLEFLNYADTQILGRAPESTLSLTHTAEGERNSRLRPNVVSTIEFTHTAGRRGSFYSTATTTLPQSRVETVPIYDGDGNITGYETELIDTGLSQEAIATGDFNNFDDGNYIGITDTVAYLLNPSGGVPKSASNTLSLSQTVYDGLGASSTLVLSQSSVGLDSTGSDEGDIDIDHAVVYSISGTRIPTSTIGVTHAVGYLLVSDDFCDYEINIGSTTGSVPALPVEPTIVATDRVSFAYPAAAPTVTLYFNAPEWGNIHEVYQRRIDRQSRGGKRIIYRDTTWREHEIIKITLAAITEAETANLLSLLLSSAGSPVKYTDHESREWTVIILNPEEQIVRDKTENTVSIQMETV